MVDELRDRSPKEIRQVIASQLASLDQQIEETLIEVNDRPDLMDALHRIISDVDGAENEYPIVDIRELAVSRTACALFRMCLRRRLLEYAQRRWPDGNLDFSKVNFDILGKL